VENGFQRISGFLKYQNDSMPDVMKSAAASRKAGRLVKIIHMDRLIAVNLFFGLLLSRLYTDV